MQAGAAVLRITVDHSAFVSAAVYCPAQGFATKNGKLGLVGERQSAVPVPSLAAHDHLYLVAGLLLGVQPRGRQSSL
jgi:hypothetical protein